MDSFQSVLGDAAGGALCNVLSTFGSAAPALTAISLIEPTPIGEGLAVSAGLAGLAAAVGCTWNPGQDGPPSVIGWEGCSEFSSGEGWLLADGKLQLTKIRVLYSISLTDPQPSQPEGYTTYDVSYAEIGSGPDQIRAFTLPTVQQWLLEAQPGAVCSKPAPGPTSPPKPDPYTHTDPASGCEINVNFQGWALGPAGDVGGVWLMEPAAPQTRNSGGVIGGCNFAPTIYYDGGGGGGGGGGGCGGPINFPVPDPVPPEGEEPWWAPVLRKAAQGVATAVVERLFEEYFDRPYPAGSYEIKGVCERDPDGNPMDVTRSSTYTSEKGIDAVLTRLDALADLFQYHKELRQPICRHPRGSGDLVTVNFVSDAPSPQGEKPLRKFLRYRDQTNTDLAVHGAHWRDFSWQAGPVIVSHENGAWGQLKVWALSADEGKRVIRHAGSVAGVDPDSDGDWVITSSSAPRYGQTGTMRVEVRAIGEQGEKYVRVTKRSDPNGLPLLPGV